MNFWKYKQRANTRVCQLVEMGQDWRGGSCPAGAEAVGAGEAGREKWLGLMEMSHSAMGPVMHKMTGVTSLTLSVPVGNLWGCAQGSALISPFYFFFCLVKR